MSPSDSWFSHPCPQKFWKRYLVSILTQPMGWKCCQQKSLEKTGRENGRKIGAQMYGEWGGGRGTARGKEPPSNPTRTGMSPRRRNSDAKLCLNIPYIPITRFNTKIEISTEFCLWKHNSEKAHVQRENPRGKRRHRAHPPTCCSPTIPSSPPARFQDTVGKNRPLILKIYSTQHNPALSMWVIENSL